MEKSLRRSLLIWGFSEIFIAFLLLVVWQVDSGILYWVRGLIFTILIFFAVNCLWDGFISSESTILERMGLKAESVIARKKEEDLAFEKDIREKLPDKEEFQRLTIAALQEAKEIADDEAIGMGPYLSEEDLKIRRIVFIHCEDEECGFAVEFKYPNCTFFYCKEHKTGINLDLTTISDVGVECEFHGKMERYDLLEEDNVCPRCEKNTLAIISTGI